MVQLIERTANVRFGPIVLQNLVENSDSVACAGAPARCDHCRLQRSTRPRLRKIDARRTGFTRTWRLKHRAVADGLEKPAINSSPSRVCRRGSGAVHGITNAIERLHEEFKRRINAQTVLPSVDTAATLFWALLASGQINMRKVDGWQTLATRPRSTN